MGLCSFEKTITCPYNPAHQITMERIQFHLVKCRRNHPDTDHVICPYNASHHVPKPEEQYHISCCPDRKLVELAKYSWAMDKPGQHGYLEKPEPSRMNHAEVTSLMMMDENWETEATIKESYNPNTKCAKAQVLRKLPGATPSERRKFYASEKQRHDVIKEKEEKVVVQDDKTEDEQESFCTPRPSIIRSSLLHNDSLRRPSLLGQMSQAERKSVIAQARPGPVTNQILSIINGGGGRRPGSILQNQTDISSFANTTHDTTFDLDTTRETDVASEHQGERQKTTGYNNPIGMKPLPPLRRPSAMLGSFVKK